LACGAPNAEYGLSCAGRSSGRCVGGSDSFAGEGSDGPSGAAARSANAANQETVAMPSKLRSAHPGQ